MLSFFKRPYYYETSRWHHLRQAIIFGLFVFLFLWFFAPFGLEQLGARFTWMAVGFGMITTISMIVLNVLIPWIWPGFFDDDKWTTGREFLWTMLNVSFIGLMNYLFFTLIISKNFSWSAVFWFQTSTIGISIFPVSFILFMNELKNAKKYAQSSRIMNLEFKEHISLMPPDHDLVEITGQNEHENLKLEADHILFIKAADNYIEIHYIEAETFQKAVFRQTLHATENMLKAHSQFFRCHRSYLVNMNQVDTISGNAQGYKLIIKGTSENVPVSRKLNKKIKERIAAHP